MVQINPIQSHLLTVYWIMWGSSTYMNGCEANSNNGRKLKTYDYVATV